jgi:hypothetical protein
MQRGCRGRGLEPAAREMLPGNIPGPGETAGPVVNNGGQIVMDFNTEGTPEAHEFSWGASR